MKHLRRQTQEYRQELNELINPHMDKAIKSPSKNIPLARLKQIKQDNAIGAGGQEYSEEELNDEIMSRKMLDAERMVREADRMQAYKPKMAKSNDLESQISQLQAQKESITDKIGSLDREHPERKKLMNDWHTLNDKRDSIVNSKHMSNIDQKALGNLKNTHDTENVMFHGSLNFRLSGFKSHDQAKGKGNYGQKKGVGVSFSPKASYSEQYTTQYGLGEGKKGQVYKVVPTKGSILDVHKNPNAIKEAAEKLGVSEHLNRMFNSQPNIQLEHAIGKKHPELDKRGIYNLMSQNGIKGFSVGGDYGKEYIVHDPSDFAVFSQDGKLVSKHGKAKMVKDESHHDIPSVVASAKRANNDIDTSGTIFGHLYGKNPNQKFKLVNLPLSSVYSHRKYQSGDKFEHPHEPLHIEGNKEDESWAQKFSKKYPSGQTAEPIIAHPDGNGKHLIVDGRHRARAAHLRGETHVKAFVPADSKIEKAQYLQKMSRPRLNFPGLPKVSTRPDQNVQVLETGRQKDLYGRKVASAVVNDYANSKPGTIKDKKPYMDIAAKRTAGKFDRTTLGINQSTKDKSYSAALGGKLRSKHEEGDEAYDQKMEAHKQSITDTRNKYLDDIASWREQAGSIPSNSPEYMDHLKNRPKYKKPRKPSKSLKATKDLSPDQMKRRGNATEATVEHEGFHNIMDQVEREYGGRAAHIVKEKILGSHDKEALSHVASYISNRLGYKPQSEHFEEEVLAHARDILVNPDKRKKFEAFVGTSEKGREIINKLKAGHQKAYDFSQDVTPENLEQEDMKQFPVPTKLAASEMEKGVARRLYGKFDPNKLEGRDAVNEWQTSAPALQDTYPDYGDEEHQDARRRIPGMDAGLKLRALNKLSNRTLTRRHPETGRRQFLLFRGVGGDEREGSIGDSSIKHYSHSSWTPHLKIARSFENDYHSNDENPAKTIAAWVDENKIHSAPHMYGNMPGLQPDMDNDGNFYTPGKNLPGQNTYALEHEVVVAPHESDRATHGDVKRYSALHGAGSKTIKESDPKKDLHARINYRADYEFSHGPSSKNYPIIRTTKPLENKKIDDIKKPKKMAASEPLNKAPLEYTSGIIQEMPPKEPKKGNFSKVHEKTLPNGLIYKQYSNADRSLHQIFHPDHSDPVSEVSTKAIGNPNANETLDHKVTWSQVHPDHKGNGYGKIAYKAALIHGKGVGRLISDNLTSRQSEKAWDHLQQQPGIKVNRGKWLPSSPTYTKEQDEAIDSRHSATIPMRSKLDEKAMFPDVGVGQKKLAASEMEKGARGDWKSEGYTVHVLDAKKDHQNEFVLNNLKHLTNGTGLYVIPNHDQFADPIENPSLALESIKAGKARLAPSGPFVYAKDSQGNLVGHASLEGDRVMNSMVHKDHQRKGIANAMYSLAQSVSKTPIKPDISASQSPDAKALWSQSKRPFGKQK